MGDEQGILATCGRDPPHVQQIVLRGYTREYAEQFAALLDGTSDLYRFKPREQPVEGSSLARCGRCGAWVTCTVFGFD